MPIKPRALSEKQRKISLCGQSVPSGRSYAPSFRLRLQSRRNIGERVPNIFLTKIMAAIFDFNGSGRLTRERNLYQGSGRRSKVRRGVGMGE